MPIVIRTRNLADNIEKFNGSKTANVLRILFTRTWKIMLIEFVLAFISAVAFMVTFLITNEDEAAAQTVFLVGVALMAAIFLVGIPVTIFKVIRASLRKKE